MATYRISISVPVLAVLVVTLGSTIYYFGFAEFISAQISLGVLTSILIVYLILENIRLYFYDNRRFLMNPAFLCSVMTLGLYYGINNVLYYLPPNMSASVGAKSIVTLGMVKLELMAIISAAGMWIGYWSKTSKRIIDSNYCQKRVKQYFTYDADLKIGIFYFIVGIGFVSRILQIKMGIYGYSSGVAAFLQAAKYRQYFVLADYFSKISLIVIALQYYAKPPTVSTKFWFYFLIVVEVFLGGFLTGFKKMVILPFIIVMLIQYARIGRVNLIWIVFIAIGIQVAYPVIEQFRAIRNSMEDSFPSSSFIDITQIMFFPTDEQKSKASYDEEEDSQTPTYLKVMARTSMVQIGALGVDYYDQYNGNMPAGSPEVVKEILLSPLYSWIPRFIWSGKTIQSIGLWYTQVVMNLKYSFSSTAMGFITYLYMGGGMLIVFLGFIVIGGLQRITREIFQPWKTSAGALLSMTTVVMVASIAEYNMDALVVLLVRMIPIIMWLQSVLYDHRKAHIKFREENKQNAK